MSHEARFAQLGIELPTGVKPAANYVPGKLYGNLLFLSGQTPRDETTTLVKGRVGAEVSFEEARRAARICATRLLGAARDLLGTLDAVDEVLELTIYVNAALDFEEPSKVADAASELMVEVFGECGRHARTSVCVNQLPKCAAVEISGLFAVALR